MLHLFSLQTHQRMFPLGNDMVQIKESMHENYLFIYYSLRSF
jgi:hypothetical protein